MSLKPTVGKWPIRLLAAVIALETLALAAYWAWGGFDFTLPLVGRIYLDHWARPFQGLLAAGWILGAILLIPHGAMAVFWSGVISAYGYLAERRHGLTLVSIAALALFLRLWSSAHGVWDYVFWIDGPQFITAAQEYIKGAYLYEVGYPHFSSHFVEWVFRGAAGLGQFIGAPPLAPESRVIESIGRALNILYALGIMAAVYSIGVSLGLRPAGTLGAFLTGVSTINVHMSHYFINDMAMAFFSVTAVAVAARNLHDDRLRWWMLAGGLAGVSFVCKYNGVLSLIFIACIYMQSRRDRASFIRDLEAPVKAGLAFILTAIALSPTLWTDPAMKLGLSARVAEGMATTQGLIPSERFGVAILDNILTLGLNWGYQLWVAESLFHPLPLWLGVAAGGWAAYRRKWGLMFIWVGAALALAVGKVSKPNAAGWHLLNISPFLLFLAAVGVCDALAKVNPKPARDALMALLCVLLLHSAIQDCSYWALPPSKHTAETWMKENIADDRLVDFSPRYSPEPGEPGQFVLQEIHSGAPGRGYSTLRDLWWYVTIKGSPTFLPMPHIASREPVAQVFPNNHDLTATARIFATGPDTGLEKAIRYIPEKGAPERLVILARNAHNQPNTLRLSIGRVNRTIKLGPGGSGLLAIETKANRAFLMNGGYLKCVTSSDLDAVWMIGANHIDAGDIYASAGQLTQAVESYAKAPVPYSLLRIMAIAERVDTRLKAFAELERLYPSFTRAITSAPAESLDWQTIAGFSSQVFADRAEKSFPLDKFNRVGLPMDGHVIRPGGAMYGPYVALSKGDYLLNIKWMTRREAPASFTVSVGVGRGGAAKIIREAAGAEAEKGQMAIPLSVRSAADYPLEVVVSGVTGGPVIIEEVRLTLDYLAYARNVIKEGLAGLKRRKL